MVVPIVINLKTARSPVDDREVSVSFDINELPARIVVGTYVPPFEVVRYVPERICHATSESPVPTYQTGCSECGEVWDDFYRRLKWMGPPNFCPRCGAKRIEVSE